MEKVKRLIDAGASVTEAIKIGLGLSVSEFARQYTLPRSTTSEVINGRVDPSDRQVEALVDRLGGTEEEVRQLLQQAREAAASQLAAAS